MSHTVQYSTIIYYIDNIISTIYIYSTCHTLYSVPHTIHVPCSVQSLLSRNEFIHHISLPLCPTSTGHSGWLLGGRGRWNFVRPFTRWEAPWRHVSISPILPSSLTSLLHHLIGCISAGCYGNISCCRPSTQCMSGEMKFRQKFSLLINTQQHSYQPSRFLLEYPAKTPLIPLSRISTSNSHILDCTLSARSAQSSAVCHCS